MHPLDFTIAGIVGGLASLGSFVIGMRVAKERADRSVLRALYQELYVHFRAIRDALQHGRPKDWMSFKLVGDHYVPLVKSLENDGRINLLPKRLATTMSWLEIDSLNLGYRFKEAVTNKLVPLVVEVFEVDVNKPSEGTSGKPYSSYRLGGLALGEQFSRDRLLDAGENEVGVGIELSLEGNRTRQLYVTEEKLKSKSVPDFLSKVEHIISSHEATKLQVKELRKTTGKLEDLLKTISSRIKDPNPIIDTLFQAIPDLFRR